jgi:hypothetical protein
MDIEFITEMICNKQCILVLGPDIAFNNEKSLLEELSNFLADKKFGHIFHDDEDFFSSTTEFKPHGFRHFSMFFNALEMSGIYQQIAEIPFHTIISLSPDLLLKQTFDKNNFDYSFDYYHKNKACEKINKPTKEKPLLYNLLGQYTQTTSLVLTFNDLFDYLSSILGVNELNDDFKIELEEAQTVFFLGFKYEKWYLKLILRLLNKDDNILRQASLKEIMKKNKIINFYEKEFKFEFEEELSGKEIINQIHKYFTGEKALRKPKQVTKSGSGVVINVSNSQDVNIISNTNANNINIKK